jgi:hypothetical protein
MNALLKARIAPMLSVRNGAKAVEFYKAASGLKSRSELTHRTEPWWRG